MNYQLKSIFTCFVSFGWISMAFAQESQDTKIIESLFPKSISSLKDENSGKPLTIRNGLSYRYKSASLSGNAKIKDLVVLYRARTGPTTFVCELDVIQVQGGTGKMAASSILNSPDELISCTSIELIDLDGNERPEVLITTADESGNDNPPFIFKWEQNKLNDITPRVSSNGNIVSAFRSPDFTDVKIGKSKIIIDGPSAYYSHGEVFGQSPDQSYKAYLMQNGSINLVGTYDFLQVIEKKSWKPAEVTTLNPSFAAEGTYTLEIKNLSDHRHAVRAEVTVNGSVVLKPQDFCASPPPKKADKDKWKGDDDDDDKDEDRCKRCIPKGEAYAIVNLKTANQIKVKVYGRGSSKLQISLVKK